MHNSKDRSHCAFVHKRFETKPSDLAEIQNQSSVLVAPEVLMLCEYCTPLISSLTLPVISLRRSSPSVSVGLGKSCCTHCTSGRQGELHAAVVLVESLSPAW